MKFVIDQKEKAHILRIKEERLDARFTSELKTQLLMMVGDETTDTILVDISHVTYADSSGLGALLLGLRQARENNKKFALVGAQKRVMSLIKIAHLNDVLLNYDSAPKAIKGLSD